MPMHDWTRVEVRIFHAFHHFWINAMTRTLNGGLLPEDYYTLPERTVADFGPDWIVVRHDRRDHIVAILTVVSPDCKASRDALKAFVANAGKLLKEHIQLLIVDPFPPGPRDPSGIHAAIWEEFQNEPFEMPKDRPLTMVSYECDLTVRAYLEPFAVGDRLCDMPVFLQAHHYVPMPLEATYQFAFASMPRRWRTVLEPPA
jgi:hypothetical protein